MKKAFTAGAFCTRDAEYRGKSKPTFSHTPAAGGSKGETMRISSEIASIAPAVGGEEHAIRGLAAAGFDAYDLSLFSMAKYDYAKQE
ncbi:MAG: hypothetical protein ACI4KH_03130, partial [Oscillospiraceae bacterium]